MVTRGPQNGRRGIESGLPLGFLALPSTLANKFFDPSTPYFDQSEASKFKMAARGPQNGRRGLTRGYWSFRATFAK